MWDNDTKLNICQIVIGWVTVTYCVLIRYRKLEEHKRGVIPFIWLLGITFVVSLVELIVMVIRYDGMMPDGHVLRASIPNLFCLLLQIDHFVAWAAKNGSKEELTWRPYALSWAPMTTLNIVAIMDRGHETLSPDRALSNGLSASDLRCCLQITMFVMFFCFINKRRHQLHGDERSRGGLKPDQTIDNDIAKAGGIWAWMKQSRILLPFILPSGLPCMWLYIFATASLKLSEIGLDIMKPQFLANETNAMLQVLKHGKPDLARMALILRSVVEIVGSPYGLAVLRRLIWQSFSLYREHRTRIKIVSYFINHDGSFIRSMDEAEMVQAVERGVQIGEALDFLILEVMSNVITLAGRSITSLSSYGIDATQVIFFVITINVLFIHRSKQFLSDISSQHNAASLRTNERLQETLRTWTTIFISNVRDTAVQDYGASFETEVALLWRKEVYDNALSFFSSCGLHIGKHVALVLALAYCVRNDGSLNTLTRTPRRIFEELREADLLRKTLEVEPTMHMPDPGRVEFSSYPAASGCENENSGSITSIVSPTLLVRMTNMSLHLAAHGALDMAKDVGVRVVSRARESLGNQDPVTLTCMNNLGVIHWRRKEYPEAAVLLEEALMGMKASKDHPILLDCMSNLALAYKDQDRFEEAASLLNDILKVQKQGSENPENDLDMVPTLVDLASIHMEQNFPEKAEPLVAQIFQVRRNGLGKRHHDTLASARDLVHIHLRQGQFEEAHRALTFLVSTETREPSEGDTEDLSLMSKLATIFDNQGRYPKAEELHRQMWEISSTLVQLGHYVEAEELQRRVIKARHRTLGVQHPDYCNLGEAVTHQTRQYLGGEHLLTLLAMGNLSLTYQGLGLLSKAEQLGRQVLEQRIKVSGDMDTETLRSSANLPGIYLELGNLGTAEELMTVVVVEGRRTLDEKHPSMLTWLDDRATVLASARRFEEAEELLKGVHKSKVGILGPGHWQTLVTMRNLAMVDNGQHRFLEAYELINKTIRMSVEKLGPEHPSTLLCQLDLASIHKGMCRLDKSLDLLQSIVDSTTGEYLERGGVTTVDVRIKGYRAVIIDTDDVKQPHASQTARTYTDRSSLFEADVNDMEWKSRSYFETGDFVKQPTDVYHSRKIWAFKESDACETGFKTREEDLSHGPLLRGLGDWAKDNVSGSVVPKAVGRPYQERRVSASDNPVVFPQEEEKTELWNRRSVASVSSEASLLPSQPTSTHHPSPTQALLPLPTNRQLSSNTPHRRHTQIVASRNKTPGLFSWRYELRGKKSDPCLNSKPLDVTSNDEGRYSTTYPEPDITAPAILAYFPESPALPLAEMEARIFSFYNLGSCADNEFRGNVDERVQDREIGIHKAADWLVELLFDDYVRCYRPAMAQERARKRARNTRD
ncbi:hypothetical protein FSARC_13750 [Fusarium sarcochroum]|uniref:Uncharacterized protein n=1 Tax=Fusarium sarcochroum TaxID=1208366 RepID=A0A8H4SZE9_9HYPO|nr:hypothetical protein FSARC_13750 [Fusarium sarcochroum]